MFNIGSFFERFKNHELEEISFRSAVVDSIKETLQYDIDFSLVSYSDATIFLKISPTAKSAIFLKKGELIEKIAKRTKRKVIDIR